MARYHYQTRRDAERQYPHRVDIPVPSMGLGKQLNHMLEWCGEHFTDWTHAGITDRAAAMPAASRLTTCASTSWTRSQRSSSGSNGLVDDKIPPVLDACCEALSDRFFAD
jgi:hypothetical protein